MEVFERFYRVQEGDTLLSISNKFEIPPVYIIKENKLDKEIEEGDILFLKKEDRTVYKVKAEDTLSLIAEKFNKKEEEILQVNGVEYLFYGLVIYV